MFLYFESDLRNYKNRELDYVDCIEATEVKAESSVLSDFCGGFLFLGFDNHFSFIFYNVAFHMTYSELFSLLW